MSAKPLPSTAEADEMSVPSEVVELLVDEPSDEDAVASALPSDVQMMADLQRKLDRFTRPIAAIESMTAFVNKFDVVNKFDHVGKLHDTYSPLGATNDLLAGHSHAADLFQAANAAAEMIAGHVTVHGVA